MKIIRGRNVVIIDQDVPDDFVASSMALDEPDCLPEPAPLFPQMREATGIEVTYVEYPGGPPPSYITGTLREILAAQNEPLLHISFLVNGHRHVTLVSLVALTQRGLPNDYEQLKAMFPDLRWSAS